MKLEIFEKELRRIYSRMLSRFTGKNHYTFCMQWGSEYFVQKRKILFVGKATNGWLSNSLDIDDLFGKGSDQIFDRENQITWVKDQSGPNPLYNTNRSAFWRFLKDFTSKFLGDNDLQKIAWSNLYKVSPSKGNPTIDNRLLQLKDCIEILELEIEFLNPDVILFLTSGWESSFIASILSKLKTNFRTEVILANKYASNIIVSENRIIVLTQHPGRKSFENYLNSIIGTIKNENACNNAPPSTGPDFY